MLHPTVDFSEYMRPGVRVHLAGIGGVSMCPLAEVLHGMGLAVQGSDMHESVTVEHLRSLGIPVAIGHSAQNLGQCDVVIRTAAIKDDNPEIAYAREHDIQEQQVIFPALRLVQPRAAVEGLVHLVSLVQQFQLHEPGQLFFVLHQQNAGHTRHHLVDFFRQ